MRKIEQTRRKTRGREENENCRQSQYLILLFILGEEVCKGKRKKKNKIECV